MSQVIAIDANATHSRVVVHVQAIGLQIAYEFCPTTNGGTYLASAKCGGSFTPLRDGCVQARRTAKVTMDLLRQRWEQKHPLTAAARRAS